MNGFEITHEKRKKPYNMFENHYHRHYEIYYLVTGKTKYFIENEIFYVESGDIVLIPKGVLHKTNSAKDGYSERVVLSFTDEFLGADGLLECFSRRVINMSADSLFAVNELMGKIEKEYPQKDGYSSEMIRAYLKELLVILLRVKEKSAVRINESDLLVQDAAKYITENFDSDLSLDLLAKRFSMSKSYFSKKFKSATGLGLNQYIILVRIMNAEKLMTDKNMSVTEIATSCGFNDSNYFASVFKKIKGTTPLKYAKAKKQ